jgi:hypothetical protein
LKEPWRTEARREELRLRPENKIAGSAEYRDKMARALYQKDYDNPIRDELLRVIAKQAINHLKKTKIPTPTPQELNPFAVSITTENQNCLKCRKYAVNENNQPYCKKGLTLLTDYYFYDRDCFYFRHKTQEKKVLEKQHCAICLNAVNDLIKQPYCRAGFWLLSDSYFFEHKQRCWCFRRRKGSI